MTAASAKAIVKCVCRLFACLIVISLTGCWDRSEVNDLATVMAVGIDQAANNAIELSVQIFIPKQTGSGQNFGGSAGGGGGQQTIVRSAQGETIAAAIAKVQEKLPRRLFWGHDEIFIFSQEAANKGIRKHVDFLMRYPQIRERAEVLLSKDAAKTILEVLPPLERSSSEVLRKMTTSKTGILVTLKEVDQMLSGDSGAAALPWVELLAPEDSGGDPPKKTAPHVVGTAVFHKDKLAGHIDDRATRGVLWFRNEIKSAIVTVAAQQSEGFVSVNLIRSATRLIPKIENGRWEITVCTDIK